MKMASSTRSEKLGRRVIRRLSSPGPLPLEREDRRRCWKSAESESARCVSEKPGVRNVAPSPSGKGPG